MPIRVALSPPHAGGSLLRERLVAVADGLAAAVVISLPWSTTLTGILIALWLVALLSTLDTRALGEEVRAPAGYFPIALWGLAAAGMLWSDASWAERIHGLMPFHKLLAIPLLLTQFRRSGNSQWIVWGFLTSCALLLVASYAHAALWGRVSWLTRIPAVPGVPVKDYITQSGAFELCILGAAYAAADAWQAGRRRGALALAAMGLMFLVDIAYVSTSRTTLVTLPVLIVLFGVIRLGAKGTIPLVAIAGACAAVVWVSSPYVRLRVDNTFKEVSSYEAADAATSSGLRMEFWRKSAQFVAQAPITGHGTGTIGELFGHAVAPGSGASSFASTNPHQQILAVAIQLGSLGVIVLLALWVSHAMLFIGPGLFSWCGLAVVLQNAMSSLFNSHLFDFTQGWIYVFGVGTLGGTVLRSLKDAAARGGATGGSDSAAAGARIGQDKIDAMTALETAEHPRILVITLRRLGDVLLTTPLIHGLRERWPQASIDVLVFGGTEGMLAGNPDIAAVLTLSQRPSVKEIMLTSARRWRRYDVSVCTQTGDRPTFLAFAAGRCRVGFVDPEGTGYWWKRRLLHHPVNVESDTHRVAGLMRLAACMGVSARARIVCPRGASKPPAPADYAVIHPSPMLRYKRWTDDGWRLLVRALSDRGLAVVVTGGPDASEGAYLDQVLEPVASLVDRRDGTHGWPALAALLRDAAVYVGADTSVTHLAAATGCPTIGLYGPTSPRLIGPWPAAGLAQPWDSRGTIQRRGNVWVVQQPLGCLPCERLGCEGHVDSFSRCLDQLSFRQVMTAVDAALASRSLFPDNDADPSSLRQDV